MINFKINFNRISTLIFWDIFGDIRSAKTGKYFGRNKKGSPQAAFFNCIF